MALLIGTPKVQYFDVLTGNPLTGGQIYSYIAATDTPIATYPTIPDALAGTNPNTNPIILDSRGEANVVISGSTKLVLKTADGLTTLWSFDHIDEIAGGSLDDDGTAVLDLVNAGAAVNKWSIANSATGQPLTLTATGDDANIEGRISSKGSGALKLDGGGSGTLDLNTVSTGVVNIHRDTNVTGDLNISGSIIAAGGMNLTGNLTVQNLTVTGNVSVFPSGCVQFFGGTTVPTGWLECDGTAVSRTTYAALFTAIGIAFGAGNGSTTFNLPAGARKTLVGRGGTATAILSNTVGSTGGVETHTLVTAETPSHTHTYNSPGATGLTGIGGVGSNTVYINTTGVASGATGGGGAHNNMQPSIVMMMIIKS